MFKFCFTAFFTLIKSLELIVVILSKSLVLSIVLICSTKTTDSYFNPFVYFNNIWVGKYDFFLEVIGITIVVGLYLFPTLFWIINTGLIPPCSDPTTGLKSAYYISPRFITKFLTPIKFNLIFLK